MFLSMLKAVPHPFFVYSSRIRRGRKIMRLRNTDYNLIWIKYLFNALRRASHVPHIRIECNHLWYHSYWNQTCCGTLIQPNTGTLQYSKANFNLIFREQFNFLLPFFCECALVMNKLVCFLQALKKDLIELPVPIC
jgi:hypothetical protein